MSQGSTVAVQAEFVGLPSFFLAADRGDDDDNVLVASGLIPVAHTAAKAQAVLGSFARSAWTVDRQKLDAAGIPTNATQIMRRRVLALLYPHR